jgi:hypothetical protein
MERKETRELDAKIRRRWAEWESRVADRIPLAGRCAFWEERAAGLAARVQRELARGVQAPTREREIPSDLHADLKEVAPQALLRDLHRPVTSFAISEYDRMETGWDRGGRGGAREIKQLVAARYQVPIETLLRTPADIQEDLATLRGILALKWEEAPKMGFGAETSSSGEIKAVPSIQDEMREARGIK